MVGVGFGELFYSKVVDTKGRSGLACIFYPHACGVCYRFVSMGSNRFNKFVESEDTRLFQSIHLFADIEVGGNVDVVFIPDFIRFLEGCTRMYW